MNLKVAAKGASHLIIKRYAGPFWYRRAWLKRTQWLSKQELEQLQLRLLRKICVHAYKTVPFYHILMDKYDFDPDIKDSADIQRLPVLTKQNVFDAGSNLFSMKYFKLFIHEGSSGGTSGRPLKVKRNLSAIGTEHAFVRRQFDWAGIRMNDRVAYLTWRSVAGTNDQAGSLYAYDPFMKELILSTFHLGPKTAMDYIQAVKNYNVIAINGYPSAITVLAKHILQNGLDIKLKSVLTTSETLTQHQRQLITSAFNCPVYDYYGSAERVCYIHTCDKGSYHLIPEYGYTEFLPADPPNEDSFRVISTGFWNKAMPLLRYEMGDLVQLADEPCPCGRAMMPVIHKIVGRESSTFTTSSGRVIGLTALGRLFKNTLSEVNKLPILESQLILVKDCVVKLEYLPDNAFGELQLQSLNNIVKKELPSDIEVRVTRVNKISRSASGKNVSMLSV